MKKRLNGKIDRKIKSCDAPMPNETLLKPRTPTDLGKSNSAINIDEENFMNSNNEIDLIEDNRGTFQSTTERIVSTTDDKMSKSILVKSQNDMPSGVENPNNKSNSISKTSSLKESLMRAKEKYEKQKLLEKSMAEKKSKKKNLRKPGNIQHMIILCTDIA